MGELIFFVYNSQINVAYYLARLVTINLVTKSAPIKIAIAMGSATYQS